MPGAHYIPKTYYRSADASRYAREFHEALGTWIAEVRAGTRLKFAEARTAFLAREADGLLCDCAQVLAASVEWEGALLAHGLAGRGWPIDRELVTACHAWSMALMDLKMAEHRKRTG